MNTVDSRWICMHCRYPLQEAVQLSECGHRMCSHCVSAQQSTFACPACGEKTSKGQATADQGFRREMQGLPVTCSECKWKGTLNDYGLHRVETHQSMALEDGKQRTEQCPVYNFGCQETVTDENRPQHYLSPQHQQAMTVAVQRRLTDEASTYADTDLLSPNTTVPTTSECLPVLARGIQAFTDDVQKFDDQSTQAHVHLQTLTDRATQTHLFAEDMKRKVNILTQATASLADRVNDAQHISRDGIFVWKINNIQEKIRDARSERQTSIYSPPFYSSPNGYKMQLRLYPYGDGHARRTHMSLFLVLIRGDYDAILPFPVGHKVTFCLSDQSGGDGHIIDSIQLDMRSGTNSASGLPKFCPLQSVEEWNSIYVRNDTIFIRVIADSSDIPEELLLYAMSLNLGLPVPVRQMMIRREIERGATMSHYSLSQEATEHC